MLTVLQDMDFFLRTDFDQSTIIYGGTKEDQIMGLAQGNRAAPRFSGSEHTYDRCLQIPGTWHHCLGAWTGDALFLAAALFVDGSNQKANQL